MKIALFGATGMIGQRILREALQRGHEVTAVARDPSKLAVQDPRVHPVKANLLDPKSVANVVAGHDAVVSAFSPRGDQGFSSLTTAARSLIAGLKQAGVRRLIVVGGAGSLEVAPGVQLVNTPDFPAEWKPYAIAHADALNVFRAEGTGLDWTFFSPAALIEPGQRTGKFRLVVDAKSESRISAEDYAVALLDELEHPKHVGRRFTVGY
jgi:putative NADH-flavin reductase